MAHGPEHIVAVTSAPNDMEAGVIVAALADGGINSTMTGAATDVYRVAEVKVLVAQEDLARAKSILEGLEGDPHRVDWSHVDVGEPER